MKEEFKIGYNVNEGVALTIGQEGGKFYRPEIPVNGVNPLFTTQAAGTEGKEGWATLVPGSVYRRPPSPKRRFRRVIEEIILGDPFYFAQISTAPYTIGGPFPEVTIPIGGIPNHLSVINTGLDISQWEASSRSNDVFEYWDNIGTLVNTFNSSPNITASPFYYTGGGIYQHRVGVLITGTFKQDTSSNTVGDTTTTIGNYRGISYGAPVLDSRGSYTEVDTATINTPDPTTSDPYTEFEDFSFNGSYNIDLGRQYARKTGLITEIYPAAFSESLSDAKNVNLNRTNGNYTETHVRSRTRNLDAAGVQDLYPGLTFNFLFDQVQTESINESQSRSASGAIYTQNDSLVESDAILTNQETGSVYMSADEGEGCLYFINRDRRFFDNNSNETTNGTVGGIASESFPDMRSPALVFVNSSVSLGGGSLSQQGGNGGWFSSDTGLSILDNLPGLACPTNTSIRYRTSLGGADTIRADFDAPGAYGDNESRFFVAQGAEANVFCGYSYFILPSTSSGQGGLIGGTTINVPDPPSGVANFNFPNQNLTVMVDKTNIFEDYDIWEFYVYIPGIGSLRIPNGANDKDGKFIENPDVESPQWNLLSDPSYRGVFTLPGGERDYLTIEGPVFRRRTFTQDLDNIYTDPTSGLPTTSTNVTLYSYETEAQDYFDGLVGRKVFILNTDVDPWIRFEGEVTSVGTNNIQSGVLVPAADVGGNGLPGNNNIISLSVNITGSVVLPQNFDEFQDANNLTGNIVYFPRLEQMENTESSFRWAGRIRARSKLKLRTQAEIDEDPDQVTTLLGTINIAGRVYNDAAPNYAEVYEIRRDPTRPSTGINQGEVTIEKLNQPKIQFTTLAGTSVSNNYTELHLSQ